jgi:hypothetical protein
VLSEPILAINPEAKSFAAQIENSLWKVVLVSLLALVPCFWHPRIEAGDLASHTYNAWLTTLVVHNQAPGLWIAPQKNNILFDILLFRMSSLFGFVAGERIAVCLAVLVFFWGSFLLCSSFTSRPPWFLTPALLALSYGWTMQMGFFNFYLSLGISFFAITIVLRTRGLKSLCVLIFLPLIWLAHPLGCAWFMAIAIYAITARFFRPPVQWILPLVAVYVAFLIRVYLASHYQVTAWIGRFYELNGADQFVLSKRYGFLPACWLLAVLGCVLLHIVRLGRSAFGMPFPLATQMLVVCAMGLWLLPDAITLPLYAEPVSLISSRFTLVIGVLVCCVLANLQPRFLFGAVTTVLALAYFGLLYSDTGKTWDMEQQAATLVAQVPENARIVATIFPFRHARVFVHHVVGRACIGRCFVIDNYEPSSGQFRLRAAPEGRIATANSVDTNRMMLGAYIVKPEDLPLWQIFQCGRREVDLCLRSLQVGSLMDQSTTSLVRARTTGP